MVPLRASRQYKRRRKKTLIGSISDFVSVRVDGWEFALIAGFLRAFGFERVVGDVVQSDHWLVWILHDQIFAVLLFHADVDDASQNAPGIVHAEIDLSGKLLGFELLCSQNDMPR